MHKRGHDQETVNLSPAADQRGPGSESPVPFTKRIGDYVTSHLLGTGGMGAVYRARHTRTKQQVALKVIGSHLLRNRSAERRFETEASAISRIEHRNVVRLLDFGHLSDGTLFYAMEHLEGEVLGDLLKRRRKLSPLEALPFVQQICAGLQAAHDAGVVHRDLKPGNVFVANERPLHLKVFDFGVAKLLDYERLTATGLMVGTPLYFAPEQAMGQSGQVGPQADLYSLGVMTYGMLSGTVPFHDEATARLALQHVTETPPPLQSREPGVPDAVASVVHWCLEKDPNHRPLSAMALAIAYSSAVDSVRVDTNRRTLNFPSRGPRPTSGSAPRKFDSQRATVHFEPAQEHTTQRRRARPPGQEDDDRATILAPPRRSSPAHRAPAVAEPIADPVNSIDLVRVPLTPAADPPLLPIMQPRKRESGVAFAVFAVGLFLLSLLAAALVLFA